MQKDYNITTEVLLDMIRGKKMTIILDRYLKEPIVINIIPPNSGIFINEKEAFQLSQALKSTEMGMDILNKILDK